MYKQANFLAGLAKHIPQGASSLMGNLARADTDFLEKKVKKYIQDQAKKYSGDLFGDAGMNLLRAAPTRSGALTGALVGAPMGFFMTPGKEEETLLGTTKYRGPSITDRLKGALTGAAMGGLGGGALGAYGLRRSAKGLVGRDVSPVDLEDFSSFLIPGKAEEKSLRNFLAGHARTRGLGELADELVGGAGGGGGANAARQQMERNLRALQDYVQRTQSSPLNTSGKYIGSSHLYEQLLGQAPGKGPLTEQQMRAAIDSLSGRLGKGGNIKNLNAILENAIASGEAPINTMRQGAGDMFTQGMFGAAGALPGMALGGLVGGVPGAMVGGALTGLPGIAAGRYFSGANTAADMLQPAINQWGGANLHKLPAGIINMPRQFGGSTMSPTTQAGLMGALKNLGIGVGATAAAIPAGYGLYRYMGYGGDNPATPQNEAAAPTPEPQEAATPMPPVATEPEPEPESEPQAPAPEPMPQEEAPAQLHPDLGAMFDFTEDAQGLYDYASKQYGPQIVAQLEALRRSGSQQYQAAMNQLRAGRDALWARVGQYYPGQGR